MVRLGEKELFSDRLQVEFFCCVFRRASGLELSAGKLCAYKKGLRADQVCSDEHKQENLHCQLAIPTDKSFLEGRLKFVFFLWRGTTGGKGET